MMCRRLVRHDGGLCQIPHQNRSALIVNRDDGEHLVAVAPCPAKRSVCNEIKVSDAGSKSRLYTYLEDLESIFPQVIPITALHIVDPNEQTVIHHIDLFQEFRVPPELFRQQRAFLRPQFNHPLTVDPVEIFEDCTRVLASLGLWVLAPDCTPLEVVRLVNITMRREEVIHDHKVNLAPVRKLDAVQAIESREQRMRVF